MGVGGMNWMCHWFCHTMSLFLLPKCLVPDDTVHMVTTATGRTCTRILRKPDGGGGYW